MEIYSKNGDCNKAKLGVYLERQDPSGKKRFKAPLPPITELPSSTLPSNRRLAKWNSTPVIHQDFSEFTFPLARKLPDLRKVDQKTFLRSTEHILATFYGLVFIIERGEWHSLKSEYLPIYFVRISVKNVKYPFRILVIDNESDSHIRVVDFIVNCKTSTSIKEDAVCWQDQEKFGAKFSNKTLAFQFYDTISRMASTIRKANELESQHLDKMVDLEIHLPNSDVRTYKFYKTDTLKGALKMVCTKEKLRVNEYYFHHMQRTDDNLDMALRIGDLRTDKIRLISKREMQEGSTNTLDKVSISTSRKKNHGMFSFVRRRFSRKRKESPQYSSAPSVIQYTDNVFMVERTAGDQRIDEIHVRNSNSSANSETHVVARATKSDTAGVKTMSRTLPSRNVKRKAPQPPPELRLIMPKSQQPTSGVNGHHTIDGKKTTKKRRAPSPPPNNMTTPATPVNDGTSPNHNGTKPPRPPNPPSITSPTNLSHLGTEHEVPETSDNVDYKSPFPVFIAPPPPDSTPPPIDECETPIGPIDSEFIDDGSVEIPVEINGIIDDTKSLDSKSSENREDESNKEVEVKVELDAKDSTKTESSENDNKDVSDTIEKNGQQEEKIVEDTIDGDTSLKGNETSTSNSKEENKPPKVDENANSLNQENTKNLTPEQLQALMTKTQNPQEPLNLQNQQLFAMQQNQQMLSNILLQQMLQQQMTQQRQPAIMPMPMAGVMPVSPLHPMQLGGGVNTMQPGGMMSPIANYPNPMWSQPPAQPLPQPVPPSEPKGTDEVKTSTSSTSPDNLPKEVKSESGSQTEAAKPPLPVKDEELVNRPLFKKMLAQVSQGKIQGIPPKIARQTSHDSEATPTSPISPTAKIAKTPTSYVASAERNIPQSKPEEERKAPITLGEAGRKSSYVDSAISKKKDEGVIQTDVKVTTKIPENSAVSINKIPAQVVVVDSTINKQSKATEPDVKIEKTSQQAVMATDSRNVSLNASTSMGNSIKHENTSSSVMFTQTVPSAPNVVDHNKPLVGVNQVHTVNTPKPTSPTSIPSVTGGVSVSEVGNERQTSPIVNNHTPSLITSTSFGPNPGATVVNHDSPNQANPPVSTLPSGTTVVNYNPPIHSKPPIHAPKPHISAPGVAVVNHNTPNQPLVNTPKPPTNPLNVTSVARQAAQVAAEKRNSQISKPPSYVGHTPHKLKIEEPVLGTFKYQRTFVPPLSPPSNAGSTGLNQNGGQLSYNYATTGRIKTDGAKPPQVAKKPRHMSEPKPTVATKPTYDIRQSKTLPNKSKKSQHINISLSLSPEERMQLHNKSGLATNAAGR